jgi:hypothetical protein
MVVELGRHSVLISYLRDKAGRRTGTNLLPQIVLREAILQLRLGGVVGRANLIAVDVKVLLDGGAGFGDLGGQEETRKNVGEERGGRGTARH